LLLFAAAQLPTASQDLEPAGRVLEPGRHAAPVDRAADAIDALVEAGLRARGERPAPIVDDAAFARRAWLEIAGRAPTLAELQSFLADGSRRKRADLVGRLLDSPGHQSRMFNYWADLLRIKTRLGNRVSGLPYIAFVENALAENMPYDEFVRALLVAEGPAHQRDNGATGYLLRDRGMPEDNMANTLRVFLGTRIECAQCHNHPFDKWTQQDFVRLVAFQGGVEYTHRDAAQNPRELLSTARKLRDEDPNAYRIFRNLTRNMTSGVDGSGSGLARLPKDYQYDDAKPNALVAAEVPFGTAPDLDIRMPQERAGRRAGRRQPPANNRRAPRDRFPEVDSREAFAAWLTAAENPRFTTVIANRMWKHAMGHGLIEPVDNLTDDTVASHPELLEALEQLMVQLDFDLRQFLAVLYSTRTWQRAAQPAPMPGATFGFAGPVQRRMTAEQAWDSLLALVLEDPDASLDAPGADAETVYAQYDELVGLSADEILAKAVQGGRRRADPEAMRAQMEEARAAARNANRQRLDATRVLRRELAAARRQGDGDRVAELQAELAAMQREAEAQRRRSRNDRNQRGMVRASELPTPAPDGHFVRRFGQSDREQIETSTEEANVPQVLSLLNGVTEQILGRGSHLMSVLSRAPTTEDCMEAAFLAILGRRPSPGERAVWRPDFARDRDAAVRDLVWVLLNTHEFLFVP